MVFILAVLAAMALDLGFNAVSPWSLVFPALLVVGILTLAVDLGISTRWDQSNPVAQQIGPYSSFQE